MITCILVSDYLEIVMFYKKILDFFKKIEKVEKNSKHKFEVRIVLIEVGIVLGILKKKVT